VIAVLRLHSMTKEAI